MHVLSKQVAAVVNLGLLLGAYGIPAPDHAVQQLMRVPPSNYQELFGSPPFRPDHRDPYDHKVDSVGEGRRPLPFRNGDGASIEGPRNPDRERQNPDLVRPPSTDHGSMSNMRWSFADSHVRIEVSSSTRKSNLSDRCCRRVDGRDRPRSVSCLRVVNWQVSICAWTKALSVSCTGIRKPNGHMSSQAACGYVCYPEHVNFHLTSSR